MQSNFAVADKHTARLHQAGFLYIYLTFSYYTWNITQNTGSYMVRNLNPERWGSLLVQEKYVNQKEKACDKKQNNNNNNNNNEPIFVPLSVDHYLTVKIIEFWERQDFPYCVGSTDGKHARKSVQAQVAPLNCYYSIAKKCAVDGGALALLDHGAALPEINPRFYCTSRNPPLDSLQLIAL